MADQDQIPDENQKEDYPKIDQSVLRQYGRYSAIVFQMLATMGLGFWGGKKINDYYGQDNNLITISIGFLGMGLAFYNLLRQLNHIQKK